MSLASRNRHTLACTASLLQIILSKHPHHLPPCQIPRSPCPNRHFRYYGTQHIATPPQTTQEKLDATLATAQRIFTLESSSAAIAFLERQYKVFPHIRILERQAHYLIAKANALKMAPFIKSYQAHLKKVDLAALPDSSAEYLDKDLQQMVERVRMLAAKEIGEERVQLESGEGSRKSQKMIGSEKEESKNAAKQSADVSEEDPYERPPEVTFERVEQHISEEDIAEQRPEQILEEAVHILRQVIEILQSRDKLTTKRDFRLHQLLAEVVHELGDFTQAHQTLKSLRQRHMEDVRSYELLGYLYLREAFKMEDLAMQDRSEATMYKRNNLFLHAVQFFTRALELQPNHIRCLSGRGRAFHRLKQYELAIKDYDTIIGEIPDHWTTYQLRGDCHFELENWHKAHNDLHTLLNHFEEWAEAHRNEVHLANPETTLQHLMFKIAVVTYHLGEDSSPDLVCLYVDHIAAGNRVHNEEERYITAKAYALRSRVYFEHEQYAKCIEDCTKAINLDRRAAIEAFKFRAQALHQIGDLEGAKQDQYNYQLLLGSNMK